MVEKQNKRTDVSRKEIKLKYQDRKFVFAETFAWCKTALPKLGTEITGEE